LRFRLIRPARWYRGKRVSRDSFPLGLDAFEVLSAGATALPGELVEAWADKIHRPE